MLTVSRPKRILVYVKVCFSTFATLFVSQTIFYFTKTFDFVGEPIRMIPVVDVIILKDSKFQRLRSETFFIFFDFSQNIMISSVIY